MTKTLLIVDGTAPKPYDPETLLREGMGGTEATVIRIAEALAKNSLLEIIVEQHNREEPYVAYDDAVLTHANYVPPDTCQQADYVVSLRYPPLVPLMQARFPRAKHFLWCHDLLGPELARDMLELKNFTAIAVSNFHKTQMQEVLRPQGYTGQFQIKVIYNPIADDLLPDSTLIDRNKLLWMSSPHKGLEHALAMFTNLRSFNPDFKLLVANPGYLPSADTKQDNVVALGSLPNHEVIKHLRTSLCLFYPNPIYPETFGLVLAEANAVGTPVIAHRMGAAFEVLNHPYEVMDCRNPQTVINRVMRWYEGDRPRVKGNPKFRTSEVIKSWMRLLG